MENNLNNTTKVYPPTQNKNVGTLMLLCPVLMYVFSFAAQLICRSTSPEAELVISAVCISVLSILFPSLHFIFKGRKKGDTFNITPPPPRLILPSIAVAAGLVYFAAGCNASLQELFSALGADLSAIASKSPNLANNKIFLLATLCTCVLPAISEELLCRGAVLYSVRDMGLVKSALFSGVYFALLHSTIISLPVYIMLGFLFGAIGYKTRSVCVTGILHFVYNFTILLIQKSAYGAEQTPLSQTEMWQSIVSTLIFGAIIAGLGLIWLFNACKAADKKAAAKYYGINTDNVQELNAATRSFAQEYNTNKEPQTNLTLAFLSFAILFLLSLSELILVF